MRKRVRLLVALVAVVVLASMLASAKNRVNLQGRRMDRISSPVVDNLPGGTFCDSSKELYCWDPQPGATEYEVCRSTSPDFASDKVRFTTMDTQIVDPEIPPSGEVFCYLDRVLAPQPGSWGSNPMGERMIDCGGGAPPGESCDSAIPIVVPAGGVYSHTDNTCGAPQVAFNYWSKDGCQSFDYPGPELIYEMNLGDPNAVVIKLKPVAPADMGLFLLSDCMNTNSCISFFDVIGGGAEAWIAPGQTVVIPGQSEHTFPPVSAGTYYVFVDSYYPSGASSCGDYTLEVSGESGVVLLNFEVD
jgi:hypothetical protein